MEFGLGEFGDLRLEKGGPFFTGVWLRSGRAVSRYARSEAIGRVRSA